MPLFAGNKHILNAAVTMNPTGERVNMAAVLIVPVFFIFTCSLQALYANMVLIRNSKIKNIYRMNHLPVGLSFQHLLTPCLAENSGVNFYSSIFYT